MNTPDYLSDLNHFSHTVWGNPRALLKQLPSRGVEFIDLARYSEAFRDFSSGIFKRDKILIRKEYRVALKALQTNPYKEGAHVVGQPGIGKTYFLFYALVHFLGEQQPVALPEMGGRSFYIIFKDTATIHDINDRGPLLKCKFVWALTDSNAHIQEPPGVFTANPDRIRVLQTTSPKVSRWKEWSKQLGARRFIMDIWSKEEVENLAALLDLDIERIASLAEKWGTIPRTLLGFVDQDDRDIENWYKDGVKRAIVNCGSIMDAGVELDYATTAPSPFFFIRPRKKIVVEGGVKKRVLDRMRVSMSVPTQSLQDMLAEGLQWQSNEIKLQFYQALSHMPGTRQAAGVLYEYWFHPFMIQGREIQCRWVSQSSDDGNAELPISLSLTKNLAASTQQAPQTQKPPYYWQPSYLNFPGIDSALVLEQEIFVFQVTLSAHHKSPIKGLKKLRSLLPEEEEKAKTKQKRQTIAWRVVFVGQEESQVKQAAEQWAGELYFPEEGMLVPVAWSVVDPARNNIRFSECDDEADSMEEADEIMEDEAQ